MQRKLTAVLMIWAMAAIPVIAQSGINRKVDEFVTAEMTRQKIPGVSLAVVRDGKPTIVKGYGLANVEHGVPVKPETIFQSGSVGKQFTAFAVMLLVDEGKIALGDPISKYLGDVPDAWKGITVRHLLSHTGGLTDYPDDFNFRADYTEERLLKIAQDITPAFRPGEKWSYSNLGYVILGIIIHKATGKFYGDFLQERVFGPIGMRTTRIISEADIVPNRSAGYVLKDGKLQNQEWVSPSLNTTADGALYLSVVDMIAWDKALSERRLLSESGYRQIWTSMKLNDGSESHYGFGWFLSTANGHSVIEHGGSWQGFKSYILRVPDRGLSVIAFANLSNMDPRKLARGVASIVDPELVFADPKAK